MVLVATEAGLVIRGSREIAIAFEDLSLVRAGWHPSMFPTQGDWEPALWVARRSEPHLLRFTFVNDSRGYEAMIRALARLLLGRGRGPRFELGGNSAVAIGFAVGYGALAAALAAMGVLTALGKAWLGAVVLVALAVVVGLGARRFFRSRPRAAVGVADIERFLKLFAPDGLVRTF